MKFLTLLSSLLSAFVVIRRFQAYKLSLHQNLKRLRTFSLQSAESSGLFQTEDLRPFTGDVFQQLLLEDLADDFEEVRIDKSRVPPDGEMVETPTRLRPGVPLEVAINGSIFFGNFMSDKLSSSAIMVRLVSGREIIVDSAQVISVWEDLSPDEGIQSDQFTYPTLKESWAVVATRAVEILQYLPVHHKDLGNFWKTMSEYRSGSSTIVDSMDLSIFTFQRRKFSAWMNPNYDDKRFARITAPSAAQRYAMALLLFDDDRHFKRRSSKLVYPEDALSQIYSRNKLFIGEDDQDSHRPFHTSSEVDHRITYVQEGGFKLLDESIVAQKECEVFARFFSFARESEDTTSSADDTADQCVSRLLKALEVYALQPSSTPAPKQLRMILKRLKQSVDPTGARRLLFEMGMASAKHKKENGLGYTYAPKISTLRAIPSTNSGPLFDKKITSMPSDQDLMSASYVSNLTPWSSEVLEVANRLGKQIAERRQQLGALPVTRIGKHVIGGRRDLRATTADHPVVCIDAKYASFYDDAYSISPETGEILIHIVDVRGYIRKFPALQQVAKARLSSSFLPSGPLHMLPPAALDSLRLSSTDVNEVITTALSIDFETGEVLGYRVFPALISPVKAVDVRITNEIIEGLPHKGYSPQLQQDLLTINNLVGKICKRDPWLDHPLSTRTRFESHINKRDGTILRVEADVSGAHRIINTLLTLYSNSTYALCKEKNIDTPIAWEHRDKHLTHVPRRFATQPLRNWISLLQQQQLRAALKLELPLARSDCAQAVLHHNAGRKQLAKFMNHAKTEEKYEAIASIGRDETLIAEGIGQGSQVQLMPFNVPAIVSGQELDFQEGEKIKVIVKKVAVDTRTVILELAP